MCGPGKNVGVTENRERGTGKMRKYSYETKNIIVPGLKRKRTYYRVNGEWVTKGMVPEVQAQRRKYHQENKERNRENFRVWYSNNKEKTLKRHAEYRKNNKDKITKINAEYQNTEHGFITGSIGSIFKPSSCRKRGLWPAITRKDVWDEFEKHVFEMKQKFPESDGRLCIYCENPWTYKRTYGTGKRIKHQTNFSIDRIDNNKTYQVGNLGFCCSGCNDKKHHATLELIQNVMRVAKEKELI